jgi:hypothetical protein
VCKFRIYSTVFSPHIYFIILISMIAGNLVEIIRFPQIQNRKCLRKFIFSEIRSAGLLAYCFRALVSSQGFLSFHDVWYVIFRLSLSVNLKKKKKKWSMTFGVSGHFYVWNASLIRLCIIKRITVSVKRKTDLKLFCYNHPGVCAPLITGGSYRTKHTWSWIISDYVTQCLQY